MTSPPLEPLWYRDAVVYELYVRSFQDGSGDGVGDFRGLTQRVDYLSKLGVTALWLLPFYPSPMRDGGYDISDYSSIHPDYGTMGDFRRFVRSAHQHGIRVITELVVNHTSDQHRWFQKARRAPRGSAARNMYVWSDSPDAYDGTRVIFTDTETSNWTWDPVAGQYYWHRFFSHQPDLNFANPQVVAAVKRYMKFWFDAGVDGLRLDAIPYLCEREGTNNENLPETHDVLKDLRAYVDEHYDDRMLLAEANQWPEDVIAYFGQGDECHMAFHFPVMPRMFMALRQEDRHPIVDILEQTPAIPEGCQWALFLRNHDELTLEMVTDEERDYMYSVYATDPRMKVNVGIRRRLAPLLDNNRRAIELLNSLLFALPGTPILYYGDEIGMGDNIFLGDRDGVRTPMQWTGDRNAGFSSTDPSRLFLPAIMDPLYGYQGVNVEAQERSPSSLLNWMRRMIALRRERRVFGRGSMEMLHPVNRKVLAFVRRHEDEAVLVVANLSRFVQPVELDLAEFAGSVPVEMLGRTPFPVVQDSPYQLSLGPHTFYWFDLQPQTEPILVDAPAEEGPAPLLVTGEWEGVLQGEALKRLEGELLPAFIERQRWFGGKGRRLRSAQVLDVVPLVHGPAPAWWVFVEIAYSARERERYAVPLAVATGRAARRIGATLPGAVIAAVEGPRGRGLLCDASASDAACLAMLEAIAAGTPVAGRDGELRVERTRAFAMLLDALDDQPTVERSSAEQSNTSIRIGGQLMMKLLRRVEPGIHPDVEVGRHLTAARFERSPRLAGALAWSGSETAAATVLMLQEFVWSQGDGWRFTLQEVARYLEEAGEQQQPDRAPALIETLSGAPTPVVDPVYGEAARVLGVRTAQMHLALARGLGDPAFTPEPLAGEDLETVVQRVLRRLAGVVPATRALQPELAEDAAQDAATVLRASRGLLTRLRALTRGRAAVDKIRVHGDYHLGQVLWVMNDFTIIDFEGEVGLPLAVRRQKMCALTDVAGMLRSFAYVAFVGLQQFAETLPDHESAAERLRHSAELWEAAAAASFLSGYLEAAGAAEFLPADREQLRRWLDLYTLDKALHELEYELGHRPDWVSVPLHGVAALLRAME